ncbi:hypothetical protein PPL19_03905 [Pseudomonas psychrotolerans L19]|nr:hypothetical protein PPL19_03905 [Pseudomonas psychrotolerans L19]
MQVNQFTNGEHGDPGTKLSNFPKEKRRNDGVAQFGIPTRNYDMQGLGKVARCQLTVD